MAAARKPTMVVNATALMAATIATSALGLVFWAVAARLYDPAEVGVGSAQISAAMLLATFADLSLGQMLARFLPQAGSHGTWIIKRAFTANIVASLVLAVAVVGLGFSDSYLHTWQDKILFIVAVPMLTLFVVQDSALLGLGAAVVVPIENVLFSLAKLILLPVFAVWVFFSGIFASWVIPAGLAVIGVAWFIKRKHLMDPDLQAEGRPLPPRSVLYPLLGKQYIGAVAGQCVTLGVPLVIIHELGATANGYLALAWIIGGAFSALSLNITLSFYYEVRKGRPITIPMLKRIGLLLGLTAGLGGIVCAALAPIVLAIVAPGYQNESTDLLRLVALSAPLQALWIWLITFWWLEGRFSRFAVLQSCWAAATLVLTWWLAGEYGVTGAGMAMLTTSLVVGLGALWPLFHRYRVVRAGQGHLWVPEHADDEY